MTDVTLSETKTKDMEMKNAAELVSDEARACFLEAQAQCEQGNVVAAIAQLTKAVALDGGYVDAYLMRGRLLLAMGDKAGAAADMRAVLEQDPDRLAAITGKFGH